MKKGDKGNINNIIYIIKLIFKASHSNIPVLIIREVIDKIFYLFFYVYLIQYIYSCVENNGEFKDVLIVITIACTGHGLLHIFNAWYQYYLDKTEPKIYEYIYTQVINKAIEVELEVFENPKFYDKYARALEEVVNRAKEVLSTVSQCIASLVGVTLTIGFIVSIDPFLLIFSIVPLIGSFIIGKIKNQINYKKYMDTTYYNRRSDYVKRVFCEKKYAQYIRLSNIKNIFFNQHEENYESIIKIIKNYGIKIAILNGLKKIIMEIGVLIGSLIYISYKVLVKKSMTVANYVALINAIGTVSQDMMVLIGEIIDLNKHGMYIRNIREFLEYNPKSQEKELNNVSSFKNITFKNVSYTYQGRTNPSMKNINITINKGEKIAIVGHNGAGKTTLIKLILRLYDVSQGEILMNNVNIKQYDKKEYNNIFSVILQDYQIYALPIAENILMENFSNKNQIKFIEDALEKVDFKEKIVNMDKGIETPLTNEFYDDGICFSGGEYQKIALSRIFVKDSEILVLDEPSSSLDPIAEFNMYERVKEVTEDKTVIFISHRLSSTRMADKIYMLKDGEIIEEGNHDKLMKLNREYADMFKKQAEKYFDEKEMKVSM